MPEAYIVDAVRTPLGRKKGSLAGVHPADLGGHVLKQIVERNRIDPLIVEDVVFGCVDTIGPQAGDIARTFDLAAVGATLDLPGELADLRDRLGGHGLAEAREAAARVHRDASAQGRRTVA